MIGEKQAKVLKNTFKQLVQRGRQKIVLMNASFKVFPNIQGLWWALKMPKVSVILCHQGAKAQLFGGLRPQRCYNKRTCLTPGRCQKQFCEQVLIKWPGRVCP